jgi:hypothetical protein
MKSIFAYLLNVKGKILAIVKSNQSKHIPSERNLRQLTLSPSHDVGSVTIQNQPTLKTKRSDYLGRTMLKECLALKLDPYW